MNFIRGKQINDGGEGIIYEVQGRPDLLMKVYKGIVTSELERKLRYMQANPSALLMSLGVIAWPLDLLYEQNKLIGFVMPRVSFDSSLLQIYAYKHPGIDKDYAYFPSVIARLVVGINLASTLFELHKAGYVVGDLNHENFGINRKTAQISIVDCDSFHITDNNGNIMRTNGIMPGYASPEIIHHCNIERKNKRPYALDKVALPTFSKQSDFFCLAVHIFRLLMNGFHPFLGVQVNAVGSNAAPFLNNEGIERNNYVFKPGLRPSAVACLRSNEIPPKITALFNRAFLDGHTNPNNRPTAEEWYKVLNEYMGMLTQCSSNSKHQYYNRLGYCPYCAADARNSKVQPSYAPNPSVQPPSLQSVTLPSLIQPAPNPLIFRTPSLSPQSFLPPAPVPPPPQPKPFLQKAVDWIIEKFGLGILGIFDFFREHPIWTLIGVLLLIVIGFSIKPAPQTSPVQQTPVSPSVSEEIKNESKPKVDFAEGQRLDADGNGKPDFVVRNGRLIGTVSGKDFGPATFANFNSKKITEQDKARNWNWRDEGWKINEQYASVIVFNSAIQNCTGFTLGLKIVTTDSTSDNFSNSDLGLNWPVYVWSGDSGATITKVGDIKITKKDNWIYADITFSSRKVSWILFQSPRRSDGTSSGYSVFANISKIRY
jgi:hypothetical protein